MTPTEFKQSRHSLGFTAEQMARALGLGKNGERTVYRIEAGGNVTGPMSLAVRKLLDDAGDTQ